MATPKGAGGVGTQDGASRPKAPAVPDAKSPAVTGGRVLEAPRRPSLDQSKPSVGPVTHLFTKENVCVHPDPSQHIPGRLTLTEQGPHDPILLTWTPYSVITATSAYPRVVATPSPGASSQVAKAAAAYNQLAGAGSGAGAKSTAAAKSPNPKEKKSTPALYAIRLPLAQIHSLKRMKPPHVDPYVIIILNQGVTFPPLCFHAGGVGSFFSAVRKHVTLTASPTDSNLVLVNDEKDNILSSPAPPKSLFQQASSAINVKEASWSLLGQFSKVSKFARDTTAYLMSKDGDSPSPLSASSPHPGTLPATPSSSVTTPTPAGVSTPSSAVSTPGAASTPGTADTAGKQQDPKTLANGLAADLLHWPIAPRVPKKRTGTDACGALTRAQWENVVDGEGRVTDPQFVKEAVFYGGCEPDVRAEVWPFLTGQYEFSSTKAERDAIAKRRKDEYETIKRQWTTISEAQEARNSKFRERRHRIEKDVVRTDRTFEFFAGKDNPNLTTLFDILLTYAFYNFDLGYCQGMSDILAPILYIVGDEAESFWCFAAVMERMEPNFQKDQHGMHDQLQKLRTLLQVLHPSLYAYFDVHNCLNLFFCFRWLLLQFKREFSFEDVIRMYEVFWSRHLTDQFHLFMAVGLLDKYKKHMVNNRMKFDDILKYINDCSGEIDLDDALYRGEVCFETYRNMCTPPAREAKTPQPSASERETDSGDNTGSTRDGEGSVTPQGQADPPPG